MRNYWILKYTKVCYGRNARSRHRTAFCVTAITCGVTASCASTVAPSRSGRNLESLPHCRVRASSRRGSGRNTNHPPYCLFAPLVPRGRTLTRQRGGGRFRSGALRPEPPGRPTRVRLFAPQRPSCPADPTCPASQIRLPLTVSAPPGRGSAWPTASDPSTAA